MIIDLYIFIDKKHIIKKKIWLKQWNYKFVRTY